ncbi:unnamed protein product [Heligmosomoides polygyrus]|uniref:Uncharacterized protein n=1 Tax=Heligmosomoides polygyrus TaxID=6339 RepID=A0A183GAP3_HELPZ|nr:unnamed protein product [Heligmosomoides polygyrus]
MDFAKVQNKRSLRDPNPRPLVHETELLPTTPPVHCAQPRYEPSSRERPSAVEHVNQQDANTRLPSPLTLISSFVDLPQSEAVVRAPAKRLEAAKTQEARARAINDLRAGSDICDNLGFTKQVDELSGNPKDEEA